MATQMPFSGLRFLTTLVFLSTTAKAQVDLFEVRMELRAEYANNVAAPVPHRLETRVVGSGIAAVQVQPPGLGTLFMQPDGPLEFALEELALGPTPHGDYKYTIFEGGSSSQLTVVADPFATGQGPLNVTSPQTLASNVLATATFEWNAPSWTPVGSATGVIGVELYDVSADVDVAYAQLDWNDTTWTPPTELVSGHEYHFELSACVLEARAPMQVAGSGDDFNYNQSHCYVNTVEFQVQQRSNASSNMAEYLPFWPGYSWFLFDADDPSNSELAAVGSIGAQLGQSDAMELGFGPGEAIVVHNDGSTVSWLGYVEGGIASPFTPDLLMGEFEDGDVVPWLPGEFVVLRRWEELDHGLQPASIPLGAQLPEVVALVWYDEGFSAPTSPQSLNPFFESFGATYPYGITEILFYERGRGEIACADVAAATGNVNAWRESIITMDCNGNGVRDDADISAGASDCNGNGVPDDCELASGTNPDVNGNGILDRCEFRLQADTLYVPAASGADIQYSLSAPPALAGDLFFLLGSTSGAWPGIPLGTYTLPLQFDWYFNLTLRNPLGVFDPPGMGQTSAHASRTLNFPAGLPLALIGARIEHAYAAVNPVTTEVTGTSHALPFLIIP